MKQATLTIGGIELDVFTQDTPNLALPVLVLFVIPHRTATRQQYHKFATTALGVSQYKTSKENREAARDLVVVVLDLRNHGSRLMDSERNGVYEAIPEKHNPLFPLDMYAIQIGTAEDVSFLIHFLPAYLYPNGERTIEAWAVTGHSLGALTTWQCLKNDPRITIGIPISGWTNYMSYVLDQSQEHGVPYAPPHVPTIFQSFVDRSDIEPSTLPRDYTTSTNPFARKKVFFICGAADRFVLEGYGSFLDRVFVDEANGGSKTVVLLEGVPHKLVRPMITLMAEYIWSAGLASKSDPFGLPRTML